MFDSGYLYLRRICIAALHNCRTSRFTSFISVMLVVLLCSAGLHQPRKKTARSLSPFHSLYESGLQDTGLNPPLPFFQVNAGKVTVTGFEGLEYIDKVSLRSRTWMWLDTHFEDQLIRHQSRRRISIDTSSSWVESLYNDVT